MSSFPSSLPQPTVKRSTPKARVLTPALPGRDTYANQERDYSGAIQVEFFFTAEQTAIFYTWWKDTLLKGGKFFNADWPALRPGPMVCQFLSEPAFKHVYQGAYRVTAEVSVRGATELMPVCTYDPYFSCGPDGDPYWDNVVLMLHFDGSFADSSSFNRSMTPVGTVSTSTADKKFGTAAGDFIGGANYATYPIDAGFVLGSGDFTIEAFIRLSPSATSTFYGICGTGTGVGRLDFHVTPAGGGGHRLRVYGDGGTIETDDGGTKLTPGAWHHAACVRSGSTVTLYLDGLPVRQDVTASADLSSTEFPFRVASNIISNAWLGQIDDLRITKGIARYAGNFTIPKAAFPDQRASNILASLEQDAGTTGWVASQPTRLTHKVVVTPFISSSWCASRVKTNSFAGKRYVEFKIIGAGEDVSAGSAIGTCVGLHDALFSQLINNPTDEAQVAFSTIGLDHSGGSIGYVVNGSSGIGSSAYAHATGDVIRVAFDQATGGMWYAKNGGAWLGGGDPAAGTSPTHTLTKRQLVPYVTFYHRNLAGTSEVQIVLDPAELQYSAPTGFSTWGDVNWQESPRTVLLVHADETLVAETFSATLTANQNDTANPPASAVVTGAERISYGAGGATFTANNSSTYITYTSTKLAPGNMPVPGANLYVEGLFTLNFSGTATGDTIRFFMVGGGVIEDGFSYRKVGSTVTLHASAYHNAPYQDELIGTIVSGQEYKFAVEFSGSSVKWYVDDVLVRTKVDSFPSTPTLTVGFYNGNAGGVTTIVARNIRSTRTSVQDLSCYQEKTLTLTGAATVSTAQAKFGLSSILVPNDGSSTLNGLVCTDHQDLDFGSQDFTIECWAYRLANTYTGYLFWFTHSGGEFSARVTTGGTLTIVYRSSGDTSTQTTAVSFPLTAWNHCALQRRGADFEFWLNGALANQVAVPGGAGDTVNSAGDLFFGRQSTSAATTWNGYLDEIRIVRGKAAFGPDAFTPPTDPYCDDSDT